MRFVLVPGAGGAGWYWHLVEARLRGLGHEAVAVDLPAEDETAGLGAYTDLIVAAGGDRPLVLVAQSMGGFSAPQAVGRIPVTALVLLNAMIPNPGETAGDWGDNTGAAQARRDNDLREGRDPDAPFDLETGFLHDVPASLHEGLYAHGANEAAVAFADPWPGKAWPDVPTHVLAGRDDRLFPLEFQRRISLARLGIDPVEVPGGHLAALSYPAEVTDAILSRTLAP